MTQPLPSNSFCILPWIHYFHDPQGRVQPCCSTDYTATDYGSVQDYDSAQQLMNSEAMQQLRRDMLEGRQNPSCKTCYRAEKSGLVSFRNVKNRLIGEFDLDLDDLLARTDSQGYLRDFAMQYWDVRFSNICNLKCRMCGPKFSHTWGSDAVKLKQFPPDQKHITHAFDGREFKDFVDQYGDLSQLKEIYCAGGESLLQKDHWDMLDHLIALGKTDVRLVYNTNLTKLTFGQRDLTAYLDQFTSVVFIVSIDATDKLFEYIRTGSDWQRLLDNLQTVRRFENVTVKFNCAVSIYNILYLGDLIEFVQQQNYQNLDLDWLLDLSPCYFPRTLSVTVLPKDLKILAEQRLRAIPQYRSLQGKIESVINYMNQPNTDISWDQALNYVRKLDEIRSENILDLVPEFKTVNSPTVGRFNRPI